MLLLHLAGRNGGAACAPVPVAQYLGKLALLIRIPIPDPIEPPRTLVQFAVLSGNQVAQEVKVAPLKQTA